MKKAVEQLLTQSAASFSEGLPKYILDDLKLISRKEALVQIHFPTNQHNLSRAQMRLKFEELFFIQMQLMQKNRMHKQKIKGYAFAQVGHLFHDFYKNHLSFQLTKAQQRVVKRFGMIWVRGSK